jgi:hypothetical protein
MSSPKRPSSLVSTTIESTQPPTGSEKTINTHPHPADENADPWLVSFTPNDPDNPLVRSLIIFFSAMPSVLTVTRRTGPDGDGGTSLS